jgi:hypothetical protein
MAHHQRDAGSAAEPSHDLRRFFKREAETIHAGVEMQRGCAAPT